MTALEFEQEFKALEDIYQGFYLPRRKSAIYKAVQHWDVSRLRFFINKSMWSKTPPVLADFLETEIRRQKESNLSVTSLESDFAICQLCGDGGLVPMFKISEKRTYAFRCKCSLGQNLSKHIGTFESIEKNRDYRRHPFFYQ